MWPFTKRTPPVPEKQTKHHYALAHMVLRGAAFQDPYGFFSLLASPQRQHMLDSIWENLCRICDGSGTAYFNAKDIRIATGPIGQYPSIVIEMPRAYFMGEAHMICAVLKVPITELRQKPDNPEVRYFTLEKGFTAAGDDRTVLCAWEGESHVNYGDGPQLNPAAFIEAVKKLI